MRKIDWLRRAMALALAALLLCAPCLAEAADALQAGALAADVWEDEPVLTASLAEPEVAEQAGFALPGDAPAAAEPGAGPYAPVDEPDADDVDMDDIDVDEPDVADIDMDDIDVDEPDADDIDMDDIDVDGPDAGDIVDDAGENDTDDADADDIDMDADDADDVDMDEPETDEPDQDAADALLEAEEDGAPAQPLTLSDTSLKLGLGERYTLGVELSLPDGAEAPGVTFATSKKSVVTVSAGGSLKAKKKGKAVITVTAGEYTASCAVQVVRAPRGISFKPKSVTLGVGESRALRVRKTTGSASHMRFTSSKPSVAVVDGDGVVTAMGVGTATITAKTFNNRKATCKIKVKPAPERVDVTPGSIVLGVDEKVAVKAAVNPGSVGALTLVSGDPAVAALSGGKLTGVSVGETALIATAYNGVEGVSPVTVVPAPTQVSFEPATVVIGKGEKYALKPVIDPGTHAGFRYKIKNSRIAKLSSGGVIKGKRTGKTTVTVTTHNGLKATVTVKVVKAPKSVKLSPAALTLQMGETRALEAKLSKGSTSTLSYSTSDDRVAVVDADGAVTAVGLGTATVTVRTFNGKKGTCAVTVVESSEPPDPPQSVGAAPLGPTSAEVTWTASPRATGYRVYAGTSPSDAELYGDYAAPAGRAVLRGLTPGQALAVCVTAYNGCGETAIGDWVWLELPESAPEVALTLNYRGPILLRPGSTRELIAALEPAGAEADIKWETTSAAIASITAGGSRCVVRAEKPGSAAVSAELPGGASASVTVMVVDTADLSDEKLNAVQKLIARHEGLMDVAEGDDVIWELIAGSLISASIVESRVNEIVSRVKQAADSFRSLYVFAFGSYEVVGDATVNKKGATVSATQFLPSDNAVYLVRSSLSAVNYAYTLLHESAHAIDYNAGGNKALNSVNEEANAAILLDVRNLLNDRLADAVSDAGVDAAAVDGQAVVDAVLDYRALLDQDAVLGALTEDEQAVYRQLIDNTIAEINATLPKNNGTMVWDALEGATNFAVSGSFGHKYIFNIPAYVSQAYYYYYDRNGKARITTEPLAEFFAAGIMGDADTVSVNQTYLPETCRYFAETLLPAALDWFKNRLLGS